MAVPKKEALDRVDRHWAVKAVGHRRDSGDSGRVERFALAYEIAACEGFDAFLYPAGDEESKRLRMQAEAGAFRAYALRRTLPIPKGPEDRIFYVLHLAALAYCSGQGADLRRWLKEHEREVAPPQVSDAPWDARVLYQLFDCWLLFFRRSPDLKATQEIVAGLRKAQKEHEGQLFAGLESAAAWAAALRLIALYHWAAATELLAVCLQQKQQNGRALDEHFRSGRRAACAAGDALLAVVLYWLHAASRRVVGAQEGCTGGDS